MGGIFDHNKPYNDLPLLPPRQEVETKTVLKKAMSASRALAELKSRGRTLPNQSVLINNLVLLEAKDSSEIENIFTTHDKLYQSEIMDESKVDTQTKEVRLYRAALWSGVKSVESKPLSTNTFINLYQIIKQTKAGVRNLPGTKISNPSGEIIYTPPDGEDRLRGFLKNLEEYLHADDGVDPLIKMAIMHYQFEAIHPFTDGNGRTGRILNILYLLEQGLLEKPVLFLSRYIILNKTPYYKGLRSVTENQDWENWILYMLDAVEQTSLHTMNKIELIEARISNVREQVQMDASRVYSKDLIEFIFEQPFCRIQGLAAKLSISRQTASSYLQELEKIGIMISRKDGKELVYYNVPFIEALSDQ